MAKRKGNRKKNTGAAKQSEAAVKSEAADRPAAEEDRVFTERLSRHHDELRWLYMELYGNSDMFAELCGQMKRYYDSRKESLKALDLKREKEGKCQRSAGKAPVY